MTTPADTPHPSRLRRALDPFGWPLWAVVLRWTAQVSVFAALGWWIGRQW